MTTRPDMHVDDYGTDFELAVLSRSNNKPLPLAGTLIRLFLFQPPTVEAFMREAELLTPPTGADGKLVYTFEDGDITEAGTWYVRVVGTGAAKGAEEMEFEVRGQRVGA